MAKQYFFSGKAGSILFNGIRVATMDTWTLSIDGERLDVSDFNQPNFKAVFALPSATVHMSGPWPRESNQKGYYIQPNDQVDMKLNLDSAGIYYFQVRTRIESAELSTDVRGVVQCNVSALVVGNWVDGDADTEYVTA